MGESHGSLIARLSLCSLGCFRYKWLKYGQKFLTNVQLHREYFKCGEPTCSAKKHVEVQPATGEVISTSMTAHNHEKSELDSGLKKLEPKEPCVKRQRLCD